MTDSIRSFLDHLDAELTQFAKEGERFDLLHLGRSALVLHYGFALSTTDIDMVSTRDPGLEQKAIELFGKGSALAQSFGLYLDPVPQGLPPLPRGFRGRCIAAMG